MVSDSTQQEVTVRGAEKQPMSVDYSGRYISKIDLMLYINNLLRILDQFDKLDLECSQRRAKADILMEEANRRKFTMPVMEKPNGFAALSRKKVRVYEEWLSHEEERKAELALKEKQEDERIASLQKDINKLHNECFAIITAQQELSEMHKRECEKQIIAPDYRDRGTLAKLLSYLFNGRANTLAEALNLFHLEQHQAIMEQNAIQQTRVAQAQLIAQRQAEESQMRMQMNMLDEQRRLREDQNRAMQKIANKLDDIRFYEEMQFLQNL